MSRRRCIRRSASRWRSCSAACNWRAERVIQAVFENLGYRARPLPPATKDDLLLGRELADIGQCCPTSFVTGNLANFLRGEATASAPRRSRDKYVYLTAGACGACRFGQYHQSYELALRNSRPRVVPHVPDGAEQARVRARMPAAASTIDMPFTLGVVWAMLCTDALQGLEYKTRPYEVSPGQTDARGARERRLSLRGVPQSAAPGTEMGSVWSGI